MHPPNPRQARIVVLVLIATMISTITAFPTHAAGASEKLKATKAQIADIKKRLAAAKGKEAEISKEVKNLDEQVSDLNRQIESGQHDISSLESDIRTMQAQIDQVQARFKQAADASKVIGYVGCSGSCTGSHLEHLEFRVNGAPPQPHVPLARFRALKTPPLGGVFVSKPV